MQRTIRRTREIYQSLSALATRTLPSISSDLKVAARLRELRPFVEDSDAMIRKIREKTPIPDDRSANELPTAILEARQRQVDELFDQAIEVPDIPDTKRIVESDLPRALKSGTGDENRAGLADIILNLDDYYVETEADAN
jgi:hypothetical protein